MCLCSGDLPALSSGNSVRPRRFLRLFRCVNHGVYDHYALELVSNFKRSIIKIPLHPEHDSTSQLPWWSLCQIILINGIRHRIFFRLWVGEVGNSFVGSTSTTLDKRVNDMRKGSLWDSFWEIWKLDLVLGCWLLSRKIDPLTLHQTKERFLKLEKID